MLAQSFKTPADLRITDAEFSSLLWVLGMLERGELVHDFELDAKMPNGFNMATVMSKKSCGSVGCIYGWARTLAVWSTTVTSHYDLMALFCPSKQRSITPEQAAIALRSYLTTGKPRWAEALAG